MWGQNVGGGVKEMGLGLGGKGGKRRRIKGNGLWGNGECVLGGERGKILGEKGEKLGKGNEHEGRKWKKRNWFGGKKGEKGKGFFWGGNREMRELLWGRTLDGVE